MLALWASVVAERLGYSRDESLSLGRAVAGLRAQQKGRAIGVFKSRPVDRAGKSERRRGEEFWVEICGVPVPAKETPDGIRAVTGDKVLDSAAAARYLESKFKEDLTAVRTAMAALARKFTPENLADRASALYEEFRPSIPAGQRGWGAAGVLDLDRIRELAP